jgi:hypothetical protein
VTVITTAGAKAGTCRFGGRRWRPIRISTGIAVLAVADVATYELYWHAYAWRWSQGDRFAELGHQVRPGEHGFVAWLLSWFQAGRQA